MSGLQTDRLWLRGPLHLADALTRSVAIVGSCAATPYGTHLATELGASLADMTFTVVSGATYGIDAAAHRGALAVAGRTIAVLAFGVDLAHPRGHATLLARIAREGLLVSAYQPGTPPQRARFSERGTLIAALAAGTVIVEAGVGSGSMSTAVRVRELGRPLMAVPGPVTSPQSAGTQPAHPRPPSPPGHQRARRRRPPRAPS